jgi:hypothetical protein
MVVRELPMTPIREFNDKDGTTVHVMTIEEALSMVIND